MKLASFVLSLLALTLGVAAVPAADDSATLDLGDGVKLVMVVVKKGTFQQGSPSTEKGRNGDETRRQVTLTQDFLLGKYPVTRGQFARFVRETGFRTEAERGTSGGFGFDGGRLVQRKEFTWRNPGFTQADDHPVTLVTYDDARAFAAWLAKKSFRTVTLPTEAQWEYACRAGTATRYYNGDSNDEVGDIAWFKGNTGDGTRPVGQKKPNALGLCDMTGNVWEWCRDWYGPYAPGPSTDPEETRGNLSDPPRRVVRGGSWFKEANWCRSAARFRSTPGSRNADYGFRILASVEVMVEKNDPEQAMLPATASGPLFGNILLGQGMGEECLCGLVVLLAVVLVVVLLVHLSRKAQYAPRLGEDGFWLDAPHFAPGSRVRYRCRVDGVERTDTIVVEPGPRGHFVYTGGQPTNIEILEVVPPGGTTLPAAPYPEQPLPPPQQPVVMPWPMQPPIQQPPVHLPPSPLHHQPPPALTPPPSPGFPAAY